jgi:hypothetical protein
VAVEMLKRWKHGDINHKKTTNYIAVAEHFPKMLVQRSTCRILCYSSQLVGAWDGGHLKVQYKLEPEEYDAQIKPRELS